MSQSHNYSWVDPNLHDGNRLCALRGHRPCTCAGLYLEPTRHFANSSIMNQSSTYHQPTIAPWYNSNWCQSDSLAQVPIPSSSQWNPSVGYNPADPLNMSIFGTGHSPMHDKSNLVAAIQFSPVQVYAPLGNTGYAQSEEQSIYYGSPAEQHVAQDPQFPLPCYWGGPKHGLFPNFESLINHLKTDHIDPQYQAQPNQACSEIKCHWEECTSSFSGKESLERHVRWLHVNPGSFFCPFCDKICNRDDNLNDHISKYHRISTWWRRCKGECYRT